MKDKIFKAVKTSEELPMKTDEPFPFWNKIEKGWDLCMWFDPNDPKEVIDEFKQTCEYWLKEQPAKEVSEELNDVIDTLKWVYDDVEDEDKQDVKKAWEFLEQYASQSKHTEGGSSKEIKIKAYNVKENAIYIKAETKSGYKIRAELFLDDYKMIYSIQDADGNILTEDYASTVEKSETVEPTTQESILDKAEAISKLFKSNHTNAVYKACLLMASELERIPTTEESKGADIELRFSQNLQEFEANRISFTELYQRTRTLFAESITKDNTKNE